MVPFLLPFPSETPPPTPYTPLLCSFSLLPFAPPSRLDNACPTRSAPVPSKDSRRRQYPPTIQLQSSIEGPCSTQPLFSFPLVTPQLLPRVPLSPLVTGLFLLPSAFLFLGCLLNTPYIVTSAVSFFRSNPVFEPTFPHFNTRPPFILVFRYLPSAALLFFFPPIVKGVFPPAPSPPFPGLNLQTEARPD